MTDQPNPLDILPELEAVHAAGGLGHRAHAALDRAITELRALRALRAAARGRPQVPCMRVGDHDLPPPAYAHPEEDVGADLRANLLGPIRVETPARVLRERDIALRTVRLCPGARVIIPCGFAVAIPDGFEGQVRPRSSTSRRGLHVGAAGWEAGAWVSLGTIDRGFRGEVGITLWHLGDEPVEIAHGERVAQLVVSPVASAEFPLVESLPASARGAGGFGSTGAR